MAALEPEATTSLEPEEEPTEVPESEATRQRQIQILRVKQAWRATRQSTTRTSCYPCTQEFRLIRRFVITQASNKQRIIDDAGADAYAQGVSKEATFIALAHKFKLNRPAAATTIFVQQLTADGTRHNRSHIRASGKQQTCTGHATEEACQPMGLRQSRKWCAKLGRKQLANRWG